MNDSSHLPSELRGLLTRLVGGVYEVANSSRPNDREDRDRDAFSDADILTLLDPLIDLEDKDPQGRYSTELKRLSRRLKREQLIALLYGPDGVLKTIASAMASDSDTPTAPRVWLWMCWLTEAAARRLKKADTLDATLLRPLARRVRFLVLSEPFRHRGDSEWASPPGNLEQVLAPDRAFGQASWPHLALLVEEARRDWLHTLDAYQSYPRLASARIDDIDEELVLTVADDWSHDQRFSSTHAALHEPHDPTVRDNALLGDIINRHLLPRFRLLHVARLAPPAGHDHWRSAIFTLAGAALGLAVIGGFANGYWFHAGALLASLAYAVLIAGVVKRGPLWAAQWLFRFPAAGVFGLFALLALPKNWWADPHPHWMVAALVLAFGAYGYLVVEVRNHNVGGAASAKRALGVLAAGTVHAFLLSLIVLVSVAATYTEANPDPPDRISLHNLWHTHGGTAWQVLATATAWSLAVGVFSQILWDDRPITAPLAHLTWRDGG